MNILYRGRKRISILVGDVSAERNHLDFSLYPYQIDVIKEWEDLDSIKTVTVVACEQMR